MPLPTHISEATRRLNPHLFGAVGSVQRAIAESLMSETVEPRKKRIRQQTGPKLNKLETAFLARLTADFPESEIRVQAITFSIANGCRFTPDFIVESKPPAPFEMVAYETKGPYAREDSLIKAKVFARTYPNIVLFLVSRNGHSWSEERVFP